MNSRSELGVLMFFYAVMGLFLAAGAYGYLHIFLAFVSLAAVFALIWGEGR